MGLRFGHAADYKRLWINLNLIDTTPFEMVNNNFCKFIRSMHRTGSNFAVKAELGIAPIGSMTPYTPLNIGNIHNIDLIPATLLNIFWILLISMNSFYPP